jgi:predicted nucleic acid-binding protein
MNGRTDGRFVLDSCVCINFLNKKIRSLPVGDLFISVITRMEVLAKPDHTAESEQEAREFLNKVMGVPSKGHSFTGLLRLNLGKNSPCTVYLETRGEI